MRILLCSAFAEGFWLGHRLLGEGHTVDFYLEHKPSSDCLSGLIPKLLRQRPSLEQVKGYDLVLFDLTDEKLVKYAEQCRAVVPTLGHSELAHQLEHDREFGIEVMHQCGIEVPFFEQFNDIKDGIKYLERERKRVVFKPSGSQKTDTTYVAKHPTSLDLIHFMDVITDQVGHNVEFMLQDFEPGEEVSVEGWFDGNEFYFINFTLEEKKFMNDNVGPNTGCAGNLVGMLNDYENPRANTMSRVFYEGLYKMKDWLKQNKYVGMIDLNSIIDRSGTLCGLEWTPRFGYDASATLLNLMDGNNIGNFMLAVATGNGAEIIGLPLHGQYGAATRMCVPPYPSEEQTEEGIPVIALNGNEEGGLMDFDGHYVHDLMLIDGMTYTAGAYGFVTAPLGYGATPQQAFNQVDNKIKQLVIPNAMYRTDIGKSTMKRFQTLKTLGWF